MAITKRLFLVVAFLLVALPVHAVQFGAGTGTGYPAAQDTTNTRTNKGGGACSSATGSNICAELTNDIQGAIAAIEAELGLVPRGTFATVLARLNAAVYSGTAGLSSYVAGDLLQASNTTTLARLANVATGNVLLSGGVGVVSAWGKVGLTTHVDGILPTANGGTNANLTAAANSLVYSTASALALLATSNSGVLITSGAGVPSIGTDIPTAVTIGGAYIYRASGTDVAVADGGTGLSSGTSGGVLGYTATGTLASSVLLTANALVLGGGAGATPTPMASLGTTTTLLHGNAAGAPTFGAVSLTTEVSGILPTANGGTGIAYFTAAGPTVARVYTFPDAAATILYSGGALSTPASGTATNLTGLPLTTGVTGILPGANGGTSNGFFAVSGPTTSLKTFAFPNASDTVATYGVANTFTALQTFSAGILLGSDDTLAWGGAVGGGTADTWLTRISAGVLQHGLPDNSSPTAHILTSQGYNNAVATAGPLFTIQGSNGGLTSGTGGELRLQGGLSGAAAGTGGAITFYTAPLAAGTTPALAMTIAANKIVTTIGSLNVGSVLGMSGSFTAQTYTSGVNWQFYNGYSNGNFQFSTGSSSGGVGIGVNTVFTPASLLDLRSGDLTMSGANGQKYVLGRKTELTTIAAAATSATVITIPADAILKAVEMRVTVQPPGTATMVVTATTSATVLQQGASMSTAINTTDVGTRAWGTNYTGVAAQTITITPNATPSDATGRVRFDIYYEQPTAATS